MASSDGPEPLTSGRAHRLLADACRTAGLQPDGARLIRLGENALFRLLRRPVIVRIARAAEYPPAARTEVRVSRWLESEGFPTSADCRTTGCTSQADGSPWVFTLGYPRDPFIGSLFAMEKQHDTLRTG